MKITTLTRSIACSLFLVGLGLGFFVGPLWFLLADFVVLNLLQASYTGFCPPSIILSKLGWLDENGVIHWGGRNQ